MKTAVLVSWRTQLQCSCANLMICSLRFIKDVLILKMLFWILLLDLKLYILHPNCYLTLIMDKTHHRPVIAPFSVQLLQFFSYIRGS